MEKKQSPLKQGPRRSAGQSLQDQLNQLRDDWMEKGAFAALALALMAMTLVQSLLRKPLNPMATAIICAPLLGYSIWGIYRLRRKIRNLKQGLAGEQIVAEHLDNLRVHGYHIFHDLIGEQFNLDHVLVGPAGIFTLETKTWSKAKRESIATDGEQIWKNGVKLNPNPIDQAKAQARWMYHLVKELTDQNVFVQPIVLFPGWWVECKLPDPKTPVLNPGQLEHLLKNLPVRLNQENIAFISKRLEFVARTK